MSGFSTIPRAVAAAAFGAALFVGHAQANDKAHFTDVLKPHGYKRGLAEATVDGQACGASGVELTTILPVFQKCMRRKGWVLDRYEPDLSSRPESGSVDSYTDARGDGTGHPRDDAALQSDTSMCEARAGDIGTARFRGCMSGRGWKFRYSQHAPAAAQQSRLPGEVDWEDNWAARQSQEQDDYFRKVDELNRANSSLGQ